LGEKCRGFLEIGVGETFSDAGDNRDETGFGFVAAIMRSVKAREAGRGTQLPCACLLERHLRRVLVSYVDYYHRTRTDLSLDKDCPEYRPIQLREVGTVIAVPEVGGLHHRSQRLAA
jgi:hypothetical protein